MLISCPSGGDEARLGPRPEMGFGTDDGGVRRVINAKSLRRRFMLLQRGCSIDLGTEVGAGHSGEISLPKLEGLMIECRCKVQKSRSDRSTIRQGFKFLKSIEIMDTF